MKRVVLYTLFVAVLASGALLGCMVWLPDVPPNPSAQSIAIGRLLAMTTVTMLLSGVVGACLSNFRGIMKHSSVGDYDPKYDLTYYLRPISGGLSGVIVFFLLLGGAITLNVGSAEARMAWSSLLGRMPYIAFALLSGYGSSEFMAKLKDLAQSLFALQKGDPQGQ
jgi:hypothetical protein